MKIVLTLMRKENGEGLRVESRIYTVCAKEYGQSYIVINEGYVSDNVTRTLFGAMLTSLADG